MSENTDTKNMETLILEVKRALKEPFSYQNISGKLSELLNIIEKSDQEAILKHMNDLMFISNLTLELNEITNSLLDRTISYVKSVGISRKA
jgi:hypothetical protein